MKKIFAITGFASVALLISLNSQAEIYKWMDDKGNVHYSAIPPKQKTRRMKATNIEDKIRSAAGKYRAPAQKTKSSTEIISDGAKNKNKDSEELAGPDQHLIKYCKNQRNNLVQLKKNYRNIWIDIKGKKTNLTQEQRKEKVEQLKTRINDDCADVKS